MIHAINLPERTDRRIQLLHEFKQQNISEYRIWEGVKNVLNPPIGIAEAHRKIVRFAQQNNLEYVTICEDDIHFTSSNSIKYYNSRMPSQFDLYLGSITDGTIINQSVKDFSGLTFYTIHKKFYDSFINHEITSNLDRSLRNLGDFIVCLPIVAVQHNGYSDNLKQHCDYTACFNQYPLYT